ncbi:YwaF family protein [Nocardioides alcanivorans]|uniref:YwaF family protein n=1 Tax=Nocardioides alcanivorans TaxID=2897352 RepID=UPI001F41BF94|nr:TIGR02206 family membrane protein [Nocardioides alcanivorans]
MLAAQRTDFVSFGLVHQAMLAVFLLGCIVLVMLGRSLRGSRAEDRFNRCFALAIPLFTVPMQVLQFTPAEWDLDTSLPFQICDIAWMVAVFALWTRRGWAVAATWLWGLTLTVQGMVTPDLASGWGAPRFWMFWGMHWLIVWSGVYLVWGLRIVPTWRDFRVTFVFTAVWAASVMVFNGAAGTNYGYLNGKPGGGSALDLLGPWPAYVVTEVLLVAALWATMVGLWRWRERASA